ncbi:PHP domain-containing protein [Methanosarcinales archaeon ex4572_44]|nr:MAG: PHP domain-containing protein [Methanosarcinales archaeon ex4572_44]RLG25900.1 MAG: PHP domain-containing protein [Methanosarcinales archaeon]
MIDLHTHTTASDGELIPAELVQRARRKGYTTIAITDHTDPTNIEQIINSTQKIKRLQKDYNIQILIGVELTHLPPAQIPKLAEEAREMGAEIIIVHGETIAEPVPKGTNLAALRSDIDILAHPGLITSEEVRLAAEKKIYLELTSRCGHNCTNGHVARMAERHGAELVVNTDAHAPEDLITDEEATKIAIGSGLTTKEAKKVKENSEKLVKRIIKY